MTKLQYRKRAVSLLTKQMEERLVGINGMRESQGLKPITLKRYDEIMRPNTTAEREFTMCMLIGDMFHEYEKSQNKKRKGKS